LVLQTRGLAVVWERISKESSVSQPASRGKKKKIARLQLEPARSHEAEA
jgi:hypothetical protein